MEEEILEYVANGVDANDNEPLQKQLIDGNFEYKVNKCEELVDDSDMVVQDFLEAAGVTSAIDSNGNYSYNTKSTLNESSITLCKPAQTSAFADDFQLDKKSITKFISQQTTSLGNNHYICNLCRQEFRQLNGKSGLKSHVHVHLNWIRANTKKAWSQCEICFESFGTLGMLNVHMRMHMKMHKKTSQSDLVCNICQKVFKSNKLKCDLMLRLHMARKHPNVTQSNYKCCECSDVHKEMIAPKAGNCSRSGSVICRRTSTIRKTKNIVTLPNGVRVKFEGMENL